MTDMTLLKRLVEDMLSSKFVYGSIESCIDSLKKLELLLRFGVISENYYEYHNDIIKAALEELYNLQTDASSLSLNIHSEAKSDDWQDSVTVSKGTNLEIIDKLTTIVNEAYMSNKSVRLFNINTNEMIHARIRSFNGVAFAIDLLDTENNMYVVSDYELVAEIVRGRKFTFDITYGFITIDSSDTFDIANIIFTLLSNNNHNILHKLNFMAYSDIANMNKSLSYDEVDIYSVTDITEYLHSDKLISNIYDEVLLFIEVVGTDSQDTSVLLLNRNTCNLEFVVDSSIVQLDKYSSNTVQRVFVRTSENIKGELIVPYEIGSDTIQTGTYLSYPFDIIKDKIIWTNLNKEDSQSE